MQPQAASPRIIVNSRKTLRLHPLARTDDYL